MSKRKAVFQKIIFTGIMLGLCFISKAQNTDTLKLDFNLTEKLFVNNNFDLLLQQAEVDKANAEIITAKLFDNPEFSYENLFYNRETKKFLETSFATGQYNTQISQLFQLAGKRNKNIKLAKIGSKIADYEYYDLLRTLKYQLHDIFYNNYYQQQSLNLQQQQIKSLKQILQVSETQYKAGNISNLEVLRIKSLLYTAQNEYAVSQNEIENLQSELKVLLNLPAQTYLLLTATEKNINNQNISYPDLINKAKTYRTDILKSQSLAEYADMNLKLQKALAVPNLELAFSYDLKGSYPEKYTGIGITMPLPLFNRNQGEIKKAQIEKNTANIAISKQEKVLETEVFSAYTSFLRCTDRLNKIDPSFSLDLEKTTQEVFKNYEKRNISLLEFMDFFNSYKESITQINSLKFQYQKALAEINYATGTSIFN